MYVNFVLNFALPKTLWHFVIVLSLLKFTSQTILLQSENSGEGTLINFDTSTERCHRMFSSFEKKQLPGTSNHPHPIGIFQFAIN